MPHNQDAHLTKEQQQSLRELRQQVAACLIREMERFYQKHPDLKLTWSFTANARPMGEYDVPPIPLAS